MPTPREAKAALAAALLNEPAVAAIVGRHVYPDQSPRLSPNQSYVLFFETNNVQPKTLRGKVDSRRSTFRILAQCQTRSQAADLALALEALLDAKSNQLFGNLLVKASLIDDGAGAEDEDETPLPGFEFGEKTVSMILNWVY